MYTKLYNLYHNLLLMLLLSLGFSITASSQIFIRNIDEHKEFLEQYGGDRTVPERVTYLNLSDINLRFYNWNFTKGLEVFGTNNLTLRNCSLGLYSSFTVQNVELQNNRISQALYLEASNSIALVENSIYSDSTSCILKSDTSTLSFKVFVTIISNSTIKTEVVNNTFVSKNTPGRIYFSGAADEFTIVNNSFDGDLELDGGKVNDRFRFYGNKIYGNLGFNDFLFAEFFNEIEWSQFSGFKLCLFTEKKVFKEYCWTALEGTSLIETKPRIYKAKSPFELQESRAFRKLVRSYARLYDHYKSEGDLQSANGVFAELKDLEGRRLKNRFNHEASFNNYFKYGLNRILKFYTNHGTNPALALVRSLYIILIFMLLFVFFPSDWDENSVKRIHNVLSKIKEQKYKFYYKDVVSLFFAGAISLMNAFTLSLNSFITLGFGNIPTRGTARFLCVLEGIIGWFLLSIFIVALINQVIW